MPVSKKKPIAKLFFFCPRCNRSVYFTQPDKDDLCFCGQVVDGDYARHLGQKINEIISFCNSDEK